MATPGQLYQTQSARRVTRDVRVNGGFVDHIMSVDFGFDIAKVPTATIRIRGHAPANVVFNAPITVDAGFNGINSRQFTGRVEHIDLDGPDVVVGCMGTSAPLDVVYHAIVYTFSNVTDQQAVTDLLVAAGIQQYIVNMPTPLWTIGTVVQPVLTFSTFGEAISKVGDPEGAAWFEFPTGVVVVQRVDPIPGITAAREYFSQQITGITSAYPAGVTQAITVDGTSYPTLPHIRQPRATQQIREVKNQVFVSGANINVVQGDGTTLSVPLALDGKASSPWVLKPDGSQAYNDLLFSNELIDTLQEAANVVSRLLSVANRLTYKATLTVDFDPDVVIGQTVKVEDPDYSGMTGNWFVTSYQSSLSESDAQTTLTMIGGIQAGGQANISPFAFWVYNIEREVIGTKVYAIVTLNGLLSKDFDGTIVSYAWSDNRGLVTGSTPVLTVRIDPSTLTNPWIVTLTVTDNLGATGSQSITINIDAGASNVRIPGLFVAFDNYFSASSDGGQTWNDQAVPGGKHVISAGAMPSGSLVPGTAVYGTTEGDLYLTTDYCKTALTQVLTGLGSPVVHVLADRNNLTVVWALTQNGQLWASLQNGAAGTWSKYDDLRTVFGLPNMRANRMALPLGAPSGGVWVFGGEGNGIPLIAVDPSLSHAWIKAPLGGDLLADINATPAADLYIYEAASREQNELAIILNSATFQPSVYFTDQIFGDGSHWKRATGLPTKTRGRYIGPDLEVGKFLLDYDDTAIYKGDVTAGVMAVSAQAGVLQATDAVNHGVFIGDFIGGIANTYILAAEGTPDGTLWKTWDRGATVQKLRPAAGFPNVIAGMNAKQIAIADGAPANVAGQLAKLRNTQIFTWNGLDHWAALGGTSVGTGTSDNSLYQARNGHWFYIHNTGNDGDLMHSTDGITFTAVLSHQVVGGKHTGVSDFCIGPDNLVRVLVGCDGATTNQNNDTPLQVYESTDATGTAYNLVYTGAGWSGSGLTNANDRPSCITVSQINPLKVLVCGGGQLTNEIRTILTTNGFATVTRLVTGGIHNSNGGGDLVRFVGNDLLIHLTWSRNPILFEYSIDNGATWVASTVVGAADAGRVGSDLGWWQPSWQNKCVAVTKYASSPFGHFWTTIDSGKTWTLAATIAAELSSVDYDPVTDTAYIAGFNGVPNEMWKVESPFGTPVVTDISDAFPTGTLGAFRTLSVLR